MAGLGDHLADSLQRPQVGANAPSRWAFQQSGDQPKPALRTQTRSASGASRSAQSVAPLPLPGTIPAVRGGTADAPAPHHLRLRVALLEHLRGFQPARFQGRKIAPRPQGGVHDPQLITDTPMPVTLI